MTVKGKLWISLILLGLGIVIAFPPGWYPQGMRLFVAGLIGVPGYEAAPVSLNRQELSPEAFCPEEENRASADWRKAQVIEGVSIAGVSGCEADNPYAVAASVRGTNNVSGDTLNRSGFTDDAATA